MLKIKIPKQYKNAIIYQDGKYVVYDESQAHSLGEFDELWEAILCLERYINNYLQWTKEFDDVGLPPNIWHEYIGTWGTKVKIKVRNGAILIERVEE